MSAQADLLTIAEVNRRNNELPNTAPLRWIFDMHPISGKKRRSHGGGTLRVFRQFAWLEVGSTKVALSRPTHQRVTRAVIR